jgi:photosystem II stability/assembly factor-like uncharacterized protein
MLARVKPGTPSAYRTVAALFLCLLAGRLSAGENVWTMGGLGSWDCRPQICSAPQIIVADPVNPDLVYLGSLGGLYRSADGGATWMPASVGIQGPSLNVRALLHDPAQSGRLYVVVGGNAYVTEDAGASWAPMATTLQTGQLKDIAVSHSDPRVLYAGCDCLTGPDVARSDDRGRTWRGGASWGQDTVERIGVDGVDPQTLYVGMYSGQVMRSGNGGSSFVDAGNGLPRTTLGRLAYVSEFLPHPQQSGVVIARVFGALYRTEDAGAHWGTHLAALGDVSDAAILESDSRTIFLASDIGILRSRDDGQSWQPLNAGLPLCPGRSTPSVYRIWSDPGANRLYALGGDCQAGYRSFSMDVREIRSAPQTPARRPTVRHLSPRN